MDAEVTGIVARIKKQHGISDDEAIETGIRTGELERDEDGNVRKKAINRAGVSKSPVAKGDYRTVGRGEQKQLDALEND